MTDPVSYLRMESIMSPANEDGRLKWHPSYGYTTREQIERLKNLGIGPDLELVLKEIKKQTKNMEKQKR
jgi:hypothetical protein